MEHLCLFHSDLLESDRCFEGDSEIFFEFSCTPSDDYVIVKCSASTGATMNLKTNLINMHATSPTDKYMKLMSKLINVHVVGVSCVRDSI